jgi:hypothetical protein
MKKIIITLAIAALTVAFTTQTQAGPKPSKPNTNKNVTPNKVNVNKVTPAKLTTNLTKVSNYNLKFGTKTSFGFSYKGKHHNHWTVIRFDARYGCNVYWDPCLSLWYYWCERDLCYYPVSYCPYRRYNNAEVVVVGQAVETVRPACDTCTTVRPDGLPTETQAPPVGDDIPPIPEPIAPRQ